MKRVLSLIMLIAALTLSAADKTTAVFTVDHQMHEGCKVRITTNLRNEKGISKIDVSLPKNIITIVYNPEKTDTDKILAAFKKIGFNAMVVPQETENKAQPKD